MKFIWISLTIIVGLIMFSLIKQHFIWAVPYIVIHLSIITLLKHRGVLDIGLASPLVILIFLLPQLLFSAIVHFELQSLNIEEEIYSKLLKFNLLRVGILIVEFPLLLEFFKRPKFNRY